MTDTLVFEEPPKKARRSEHHSYLLALQDHPGKWARFRAGEVLSEKVAGGIANQLRTAASNVAQGYDVTARRLAPNQIPATVVDGSVVYGIWIRFKPSASDQPPEVQAAEMNTEAMAVQADAEEFARAARSAMEVGVILTPQATAADVLQRGVVEEAMPWDNLPEVPPLRVDAMPVGGAVPSLTLDEFAGRRTSAYGDPAF